MDKRKNILISVPLENNSQLFMEIENIIEARVKSRTREVFTKEITEKIDKVLKEKALDLNYFWGSKNITNRRIDSHIDKLIEENVVNMVEIDKHIEQKLYKIDDRIVRAISQKIEYEFKNIDVQGLVLNTIEKIVSQAISQKVIQNILNGIVHGEE